MKWRTHTDLGVQVWTFVAVPPKADVRLVTEFETRSLEAAQAFAQYRSKNDGYTYSLWRHVPHGARKEVIR